MWKCNCTVQTLQKLSDQRHEDSHFTQLDSLPFTTLILMKSFLSHASHRKETFQKKWKFTLFVPSVKKKNQQTNNVKGAFQ